MLGLLLAVASVWSQPARSQSSLFSDPNAVAESAALFQKVLSDPGNVELSLRHAQAAAAAGDLEAAIGSLERVLFYNPALPSVRLELGALYFRLGSYEIARTHMQAIATSGGDDEQRSLAALYLKEIDKRTSPISTTGQFHAGLRSETNANAGNNLPPGTSLDPLLVSRFRKNADNAAFGSGSVLNTVDFGNQRGDTWETFARGYAAAQRELHYLNTAILDVTTGPRLALFPEEVRGWSIRPYVGISGVTLGGSEYLVARTAGASIAYAPEPGWLIEVGGDRSARNFSNSRNYPNAEDQTGTYDTAWGLMTGRFILGTTWAARLSVSDNKADARFLSYIHRGLDLSLSRTFYGRVAERDVSLTLTPFVSFGVTHFDTADPTLPSGIVRRDHERRAGLYLETMIGDTWGLGVRTQYTQTNSNIRDFQYDNLLVLGGPVFKF